MDPSAPYAPPPSRRPRRALVVAVLVAVFGFFLMQQVLNPYGEAEYTEVPHGNHSHFVPRDRDAEVDIGQFPTRPPGPSERITPQGQIVPK